MAFHIDFPGMPARFDTPPARVPRPANPIAQRISDILSVHVDDLHQWAFTPREHTLPDVDWPLIEKSAEIFVGRLLSMCKLPLHPSRWQIKEKNGYLCAYQAATKLEFCNRMRSEHITPTFIQQLSLSIQRKLADFN